MIGWLLRTLGVEEDRPQAVVARFPPAEAERRYECVRQQAEQAIARADARTALNRQRMVSWEDLYDPGRRS